MEIMSHIVNDRAQKINARSPAIDKANQTLDENIAQLAAQKAFLTSNDVRIKTQEEMVRYSAEKSRAMNIQIMFFVALNVVALGTVFSVYKSMPPK
jgi:ubiquinone biosynthesis protein COQ9